MLWIGDRRVGRAGLGGVRADGRGLVAGILAGMAVAVAVSGAGCRKDTQLAGREIPHVTVRTVTDGDVVLDRSATAKQVAYAFLRAVRDDVRASSPKAREEALRRQLDLCAPDTIFARYEDMHQRSGSGYVDDRDERIYRVVDSWAPTLAHYVDSFDFAWSEAETALVVREARKPAEGIAGTGHVFLEVVDPGGDPNAEAVVQLTLVTESGYWRILNVGFVAGRRHLAARTAAPTSAPRAAASAD